jgi:hypothetical protein
MEGAPEICGIAEAERQRDLFVGQTGAAEIFQGNLGAQFIPQAAKRKALLAELAPQGTLVDPEKFRRFLEGRGVRDIVEQDSADLAGNPYP